MTDIDNHPSPDYLSSRNAEAEPHPPHATRDHPIIADQPHPPAETPLHEFVNTCGIVGIETRRCERVGCGRYIEDPIHDLPETCSGSYSGSAGVWTCRLPAGHDGLHYNGVSLRWTDPGVTDQPEVDAEGPFDQWAIVELMGHRRVAGRVREVQLAGAGFLRLDIPATDGHGPQTQYLSPGSVYALHPTSEAVAHAAAGRFRPEPVSRWELPGLVPVRPSPERGDSGYDEWAAEGSASAVDPGPDYGKDLDDEDDDDGPF